MVKLALLPGDLLAHLLSYYDVSYAVVALWNCGNRTLNAKLSEWIHIIHLEDQNPASTSRYPKMLSHLTRLRTLRIIRLGSIGPPLYIALELQKLSSTLLELTVNTDEELLHFREFPEHFDLEDSYQPRANQLRFWNIAQTFPHLRKLVVWSKVERFIERDDFEWSSHLHEILPPNLEHLELIAFFQTTNDAAKYLPKTLHTLKFPSLPFSLSWPPNLTTLSGGFHERGRNGELRSNDLNITFSDVAKTFPPSLTAVALSEIELQELSKLQFPLSMTKLESLYGLQILEPSQLSWIPSNLTSFLFSGSRLSGSVVATLPRTVTSIKLFGIDFTASRPSGAEALQSLLPTLWPPSLMSLAVREILFDMNQPNDFHGAIQALPTSLAHLKIRRSQPLVWDFNFPLLRSLNFYKIKVTYASQYTYEHLESLVLPLQSYISFAPHLLSSFPALTDLIIKSIFSDVKDDVEADQLFEVLPKKLKKLELNTPDVFIRWSPSTWTLLPSLLESLEIHSSFKCQLHMSAVLPYLPPNLKHLELAAAEPPTASDMASMMCLPKLRYLSLNLPTGSLPSDYDLAPVAELWPASHFFRDNFGLGWSTAKNPNAPNPNAIYVRRAALIKQSRAYPDPRIAKPH